MMWRRAASKKKVAKARESVAVETGNAQNVEPGTTYTPGNGKKYMPVGGESRNF